MLKRQIKNILRPVAVPIINKIHGLSKEFKIFQVPIDRLLRGGENGIRAAKYAELTNNFLRPSTPITEGPHVKFLKQYEEIGEKILTPSLFQQTDYYKNAYECMSLTGAYFYDKPEKIVTLAERLIKQHQGEKLDLPRHPGQSDPNQPIWVRPIQYSSYYEVIDGNHRIARAILRGDKTIPALIYEKTPALTPLQQLLLDCLWINKQKWLYQPVEAPELKDEWVLIRQCTDRFEMMKKFLGQVKLQPPFSYVDIGSSYGWFVKQMTDLGAQAFGIERDPFGMDIGFKFYGVQKEQIIHGDLYINLEKQCQLNKQYDVVSCLSVLHHFVLGKSSASAEQLIKLLDKVTGKVLFIDTGEEHEEAFRGGLKGWNPSYIQDWLKQHTTFNQVIPLGIDRDRVKPFEFYYNRTLFACIR